MGIRSTIRSVVNRITGKTETTTSTSIAPTSQPSVRSVDVGTRTQERTGAITVVGGSPRTSGGGGGGGTITEIQGNLTPQQAQKLVGNNAQISPTLQRVSAAQLAAAAAEQRQKAAQAQIVRQQQRNLPSTRRNAVVTQTDLPPVKQAPVRSVDYGKGRKDRTGAVTYKGDQVIVETGEKKSKEIGYVFIRPEEERNFGEGFQQVQISEEETGAADTRTLFEVLGTPKNVTAVSIKAGEGESVSDVVFNPSSKTTIRTKENVKETSTIQNINNYVAEKVTIPAFNYLERKGWTQERMAELSVDLIIPDGIEPILAKTPLDKPIRNFGKGFYLEQLQTIRNKPVTFAAPFVIGAGVGAGVRAVGLGLQTAGLFRTAAFAEDILTYPVGFTLAGLYSYNVKEQLYVAQGSQERGAVIGKSSREVVLFGFGYNSGQKISERITDLIRTRGMKELPATEIIASEYFQGQKYPSAPRGTRASQLMKEFYEPVLPTEIPVPKTSQTPTPRVPRGFTASPSTIKSVTTIEKGSSEVAGMFSAPKLSPAFLKVVSEKSTVYGAAGSLTGGLPTAIRLRFNSLGYAQGVSGRTRLGTGRYNRGFFERIQGTGKTYIPAAKTEKEAITAFGSEIYKTRAEYFIKFEGRRVPIYEFEIRQMNVAVKGQKVNFKDVLSSSSSSRVSSRSLISPESLAYSYTTTRVSYSPSYSRGGSSSSVASSSSLSSSAKSSASSLSSSLKSSGSSASSFASRISSLTSSYSKLPSSSTSYGRSTSSGGFGRSTSNVKFLGGKTQAVFNKPIKLYVKEKGAFKFKGAFPTITQAVKAGKFLTGKDITRSFKISAPTGTPLGYRRSRAKGQKNVFVELPKTALSQRTEQSVVQLNRILKGGKRRR